MILLRKSSLFYLLIALVVILGQSRLVSAQELSFAEAVAQGLQQNSELMKLTTQVESLESNLAQIRASQSWQVQLSASSLYSGGGRTDSTRSIPSVDADAREWGEYGMQVSLQKILPFGLMVKPDLAIDLNELSSELQVRFDQQLYPFVPTESEKSYLKGEWELKKGILKLQEAQATKLVGWITDYLSLVRLDQQIQVQQRAQELAADELQEITASYQIGEASRQQLLNAQVELKQAEYQLQNSLWKLDEEREALRLELGLKVDDTLVIEEEVLLSRLQEVVARVAESMGHSTKVATSGSDLDRLQEELAHTDYQLLVNQLEKEALQQELAWLRKEGKTDVNLNGNYNSQSTEWSVGVNLSYQLADGGQRQLRLLEKEEQLRQKEQEFARLYALSSLEVEKLGHQLELGELALAKEELKLEKVILEVEVAQTQYEWGVLDQGSLEHKELLRSEAELAVKSAQDQLLLQQLRLAQLLQPNLVVEWLGKEGGMNDER